MTRLIELNAGPLSMSFDPELAMLRHVRLGDHEVVRAVFAAIRDRDWGTCPFEVDELKIEQFTDQFQLSYLATCSDVPFHWRGRIGGTADGTVCCEFNGEADDTFLKNRIGLCVLHPIAPCAGRPCQVGHTDGTVEVSQFPQRISPHQPFKDIKFIQHTVDSRIESVVHFEGETFEMEDQRNWTDASYKTYSTPLELPFPVQIDRGWKIDHTVTIQLQGSVDPAAKAPSSPGSTIPKIQIDWDQRRPRVPLGFTMVPSEASPPDAVRTCLSELGGDHLRVDIDLGRSDSIVNARRTFELATEIDCQLECAVFAEDTTCPRWREMLDLVDAHPGRVARWLVFHPTHKTTPDALADSAVGSLNQRDPAAQVAIGTNAYFAELNRGRPKMFGQSLVCYSITPQVHAFDNLSVCETLEAQTSTVETADSLFGRPVVISPITLRPRFNPNATSANEERPNHLPETDVRQSTGFAAAWTAAALGKLAIDSRVESLTMYETHGPRGLMTDEGVPYPLYAVMDAYLRSESVCRADHPHPLAIGAIGLIHRDGGREALVANMSDTEQSFHIDGASESPVTVGPESARVVAMENPS